MADNIENPDQERAPVQPEPQDAASSEETQDIPQDSRTLGMLCHLLGLLTNFLGPLILWLIKKDEDKFVDRQGKEALNFQITVAIAFIVSSLLSFVCIGFLLMPAVAIVDLVFCIMACVKANQGQDYRYPLTIRFVK
jgi:hypothetical protein